MSVHNFMEAYRENTMPAAFPKTRIWRMVVGFDLKPHRRSVELGRIHAIKRGYGSAALDWLCGLSDDHGVRLQGFIEPFAEKWLDQDQLIGWYHRHGFEITYSDDYWYIDRVASLRVLSCSAERATRNGRADGNIVDRPHVQRMVGMYARFPRL